MALIRPDQSVANRDTSVMAKNQVVKDDIEFVMTRNNCFSWHISKKRFALYSS